MSKPTMGKYGQVIQKARSQESQNTEIPENQKTGKPEIKEEDVNLSIKVSKKRRQHWAAEAKRHGTTLTAVVVDALSSRFGEPIGEPDEQGNE